jgi:hypothetical protein
MDTLQFDQLVRNMVGGGSRRGLLHLGASLPLAGSLATWLGNGDADAKKKRKRKHKKKKKCGKAGGKPIKGKCCKGAIAVDGVCRTCDVCPSGCAFALGQQAIDAASAGTTIAFCPGTYGGGLTIAKDLRLIGAGDDANGTIVLGAGGATLVNTTTGDVVLQNLRLTGGGGQYGGAISHASGTLELIGCTVSGNTARNSGSGGGIYNEAGTLKLTNSEISDNTAKFGGGIYNVIGTVLFDAASRLIGNTAGSEGGGIYNNSNGTVTLASSANVSGNTPNNCDGAGAVALCSG